MNIRRTTFAILLVTMTCIAVAGQAPPPPPTPRITQTASLPPDRKAYVDALRITDPQKKVEALEKFVADFPDSFLLSGANQQILTTLARSFPDQQDRILDAAKKTIASAQEPLKGGTYTTVVYILLDNGILLDKAEDFAREGLAWVEEDQAKRLKLARAPYYASLGRLNLKRGKLKEAEKYLKDAISANPQSLDAMIGLAELAEKKNDTATALNYYASASLTGRMKPDSREKFFDLYRRNHEGSLKGLEELLDQRYRKDFPSPIKVEHYAPPASRSERLVLAEVFTGAGCGPCVAADLAFDAYLERYPRKDLAVIMYHLHIPLPDPMTNASTEARAKYYAVNSVPSYAIDGEKNSGGGSREMTKDFYNRTTPTIEKRLASALDAAGDTAQVKVRATVDQVKAGPRVRLQVALVEEMLRYNGENGVRFHPMVVRSLAGPDAGGFVIDASKPTSVDVVFDLARITQELKAHLDQYEERRKEDKFQFSQKKHEIDASALSVVAFVQDDESKQILQAVSIRLKPTIASSDK
jgi:tetratricopeptide (TPR) repeat protein